MFVDSTLQEHLETSSSVKNRSFIAAEWNMNVPDNILKVGNYRYRKTGTLFNYLSMEFRDDDASHKNGTNSDTKIENGFDEDNEPVEFLSTNQKEKLYYSLDDCLGRFRPRSGINKARWFQTPGEHYYNGTSTNGLGRSYLDTNRPRYYMASRDDKFKYWTSLRTEGTSTYGISNRTITGASEYGIDDAVPFVVYKNAVPANRVVVKMQTNVGTTTVGDVQTKNGLIDDPLFGRQNQTTPVKWRIQGLVGNNWEDLKSFTSASVRQNGNPIIGADGYVELSYGLIVPEEYRGIFVQAETYSTSSLLPVKAVNGYAYLIKESPTDIGTYHIWIEENEAYETFTPVYSWDVAEETVDRFTHFVTDTTNPDSFVDTTNQFTTRYRQLQYLRGLRIVVETMNKLDSTFDLIEMSTRLNVNITDKTKSISAQKIASDLGVSGLPVGQLLVSTGSIEIFDFDNSFNKNNSASIVAQYAANQIQFKIYDVIAEVLDNGTYYDYYVPIKTLYGDGFPEISGDSRSVKINLRDMFSHFESFSAPQILVRNASLTYAVSFLLDNIGFSNYVFKRVSGEKEPIIPFFYVEPDTTVAEILNEIARSTQTAMFFDEYNNFVLMSRQYMMPDYSDRAIDLVLYGSKDSAKSGVERNAQTKPKLANIISIASQDTQVYNDGKINYTTRDIERSYASIEEANKLDRDKRWTYKPSLLWEVSPGESTKSQGNSNESTPSTYALTAIPLKTTLSAEIPYVDAKRQIRNNIIDFGDGAQWMGRYAGYFYANGEVIRYDAVQYKVLGESADVWISSLEEYQYYFSRIPFNGKMYPTGLVRIYVKPFYAKDGLPLPSTGDQKVEQHGRGQFGTRVVEHKAGLSEAEWTSKLSGVTVDSDYLFSAVGNFQLKDAFVPFKANIPVRLFGDGSKDWELSAPGSLSQDSGTANATVTATDIRKEKEHEYSLLLNGIKAYSVRQKLDPTLNKDNKTSLGSMQVTNIETFTTTSRLTISITLPSFRSFFTTSAAALKAAKTVYDWTLVGSKDPNNAQNSKLITGTINCGKTPGTTRSDAGRTIFKNGTTVIPNTDGSPASAGTDDNEMTFTIQATVLKGEEANLYLLVGSATDVVASFSITTGTVSAALGSLTNIVLADDNRTIVVEDTSSIKVGQEVILYKKDQTLTGNNIDIKTENPFSIDNKNKLRVASIVSSTKFKIKHKGDTSPTLKGITAANLGKDIQTITFNNQRFLSSDPTKIAGGKTNSSGTRDSEKLAKGASITGVIKNYLTANTSVSDTGVASSQTVPNGGVQSSALVMSGPAFTDANDPESVDFLSYTYKDLGSDSAKYKYFGTRLRIIGKHEYGQSQSGVGEETWYTGKDLSTSESENRTDVKASSGGIAVLLNPKTNNGYYFEIAAISDASVANKVTKYSEDGKQIDDPVHNLLFYKMNVGLDEEGTLLSNEKATPVKLWGGLTNVLVDSGLFVGQSRMTSTDAANTVYDLGVEYEVVNENSIRFYLYVNNILVGSVTDTEPFIDATTKKPLIYNNMALFVRGKAKCMFEHVFALAASPSQSTETTLVSGPTITENGIFGDGAINFNESMRKYAMSGLVSETYLRDITPNSPTSKTIYFDEFGTIMREAAYFNVRYDKSYPALKAQIAPTYSNNRGFFVSGFLAGPYSAEFMVFNATDSVLVLDGSGGNYLRIQGVTFTQQSTHELTVDEYFSMRSSLSDPQEPPGSSLIKSPLKEAQEYNVIRNSRSAYGKKEFTLDSRYIQSQDEAGSLMEWILGKIMKPRKSVGLKVFSMPILQLGDLVTIDMKNSDGIDEIVSEFTRFVVYRIDYEKSSDGPSMSVYLSEVA